MTGVIDRGRGDWLSSGVAGGLLLLVLVGGLVTYKSSSALRQIERARTGGAISTRADVVPVVATPSLFSAVYRRSSRLGPSLAMMLAAPALNPAALVLTFLLFSTHIAWTRLVMSLMAVFVGTAVVARIAGRAGVGAVPTSGTAFDPPAERGPVMQYLQSLAHVTIRTVPLIVIGVMLAMLVHRVDRLARRRRRRNSRWPMRIYEFTNLRIYELKLVNW